MNILISRCLLGVPCRYDGKSVPVPGLEEALTRAGHTLIPVCPEVDGGLPTPRPPAELQSDGRVVNREGKEVTAQYQAGAELAARLAQEHGCTVAVLKAKSPSCGGRQVYDGSFSKRLIRDGREAAGRDKLERIGVKFSLLPHRRKAGHISFLICRSAFFSNRDTWAWEMPISAETSIWVLP